MASMLNRLESFLYARGEWLRRLLDNSRDIDKECGHPFSISVEDYNNAFERRDVCRRIVSLYPDETWNQDPVVFETEEEDLTEFEKEFIDLNNRFSLFSHLARADVLSGIGRFGILLLGIDDGEDLNVPIAGVDLDALALGEQAAQQGAERKLLFLRPLDESVVEVRTLETNNRSPRFGLPVEYGVHFADNITGDVKNTKAESVHWSRVIHFADNRKNSEVFGTPRLQWVYNRILDLRKVAGGSGEMFWKGGFPGLSMESQPDLQNDVEFDKEATKEQIESYMQGLQRYIATVGMTVKSLEVQVADPRPAVEVQLKLIATAMAVPWRIFVGSESAHLASEQDTAAWNKRLTQRRRNYVNPFVLRPLVARLIALGILPTPSKFDIWWPDVNTPSDEAKATVAEKKTNALSKYILSGGDALVPPFYFLTEVLGMEDDEAKAIVAAAGDALDVMREANKEANANPIPPRKNGTLSRQPTRPAR